jgi:SAM-dependent methyltransferase
MATRAADDPVAAAAAAAAAAAVAQRLLDAEPLRAPALAAVIRQLDLPPGSRGVDVGCGIGLQALMLAQALGDAATVYGVDRDEELVADGSARLERAGASAQVSLCTGDRAHLPFRSGTFDWAWSADCVGYPAGDLEPALREMARTTRPGGRVVVLGWVAQRVLPGHPLLEARLNGACSAYGPHLAGVPAGQHFERALGAFHAVGLVEATAHTVAHGVTAPLAPPVRRALVGLLDMLWTAPAGEEGADAWAELQRLRTPGSAGDILDVPGYHAWFAHTVFTATVPHRPPGG